MAVLALPTYTTERVWAELQNSENHLNATQWDANGLTIPEVTQTTRKNSGYGYFLLETGGGERVGVSTCMIV